MPSSHRKPRDGLYGGDEIPTSNPTEKSWRDDCLLKWRIPKNQRITPSLLRLKPEFPPKSPWDDRYAGNEFPHQLSQRKTNRIIPQAEPYLRKSYGIESRRRHDIYISTNNWLCFVSSCAPNVINRLPVSVLGTLILTVVLPLRNHLVLCRQQFCYPDHWKRYANNDDKDYADAQTMEAFHRELQEQEQGRNLPESWRSSPNNSRRVEAQGGQHPNKMAYNILAFADVFFICTQFQSHSTKDPQRPLLVLVVSSAVCLSRPLMS